MSTTESKKSLKSKEQIRTLRRWIFQAIRNDAEGNGVPFSYINKFLEWKEKGASKKPEIKEIVKAALKMGTLVRVDRMYRLNANKMKAGKKMMKKKSPVKKAVKKVTPKRLRESSTRHTSRSSAVA